MARLPKWKIGQAQEVYWITGGRHKEAAACLLEQLENGISLAQEISLLTETENKFFHAADQIAYE